MRKTLLSLFCLLCLLITRISLDAEINRDSLRDNTISLNIAGGGALYGFNYDRLIKVSSRFYISPIVGIGYTQISKGILSSTPQEDGTFVIPHSITTFFGKRDLKPEIGFGGTYALEESVKPYLYYPSIGFRWHPKKSKQFQLRFFGNFILNDSHKDYQLLFGTNGNIKFSRIGLTLGVRF